MDWIVYVDTTVVLGVLYYHCCFYQDSSWKSPCLTEVPVFTKYLPYSIYSYIFEIVNMDCFGAQGI